MKEIKIVSVTPVEGATIQKVAMRYSSQRPGFEIETILTLADGRTLTSRAGADKKKDVMPRIEKDNAAAAAGAYIAEFNAAGEFHGTSQRWSVGVGGMKPLGSALALA